MDISKTNANFLSNQTETKILKVHIFIYIYSYLEKESWLGKLRLSWLWFSVDFLRPPCAIEGIAIKLRKRAFACTVDFGVFRRDRGLFCSSLAKGTDVPACNRHRLRSTAACVRVWEAGGERVGVGVRERECLIGKGFII